MMWIKVKNMDYDIILKKIVLFTVLYSTCIWRLKSSVRSTNTCIECILGNTTARFMFN